MRVYHFIDTDAFAGTERHILDLAHGQRTLGVDVEIACPGDSPLAGKATAIGIPVLPIESRGLGGWRAVRQIRTLLRQGSDAVVHVHNGRTAMLTAVASTAVASGCCLMTQHFLSPAHLSHKGLKAALFHAAHAWVNGKVDHFVAISEAVREAMLARHEAPVDRITVVHNGLSCSMDGLPPPEAVRAELGVAPETPLVVCVARLEIEKDIATLLAAMPAVLRQNPEARAVVIGDGSQRQALQAEIRRLQIGHAVRLLGFREEARAFIRAADLVVLPSRAEPFGLVLLEAMALGKPVIATDAGGPREIVVEGETGRLVPPGQPEALAEALTVLVSQPDRRGRMGQNGRDRYRRFFSVAGMAAQTLDVYRHVLRQRPG